MPQEVYVKVVGDDGVDTYQPVEIRTLEIPAEVIHEHPVYKTVVKESIKRREKVAKLQEQVNALSKEEDDDNPTPAPAPQPEPLNFRDRAELFKFIQEEQEKVTGASQSAAQQRKTLIDGLIVEHKLGSDAYEVLDLSSDPTKTASALGRSKLRFDDVSGGEQTTETRLNTVVAAVAQRLELGQ